MAKRIKNILSVMLSAILVMCVAFSTAAATEIVASDYCEDKNVIWTLYSDGVLTFTGSGEIGCFETYSVIKTTESTGMINYEILDRIKKIVIPASISYIHPQAFQHCDMVEEVIVDENNPYYTSVDGVMFNKNMTILEKYPSGSNRSHYTVPETVEHIDSYAFMRAKNLKTIDLPASLKTINYFSFFESSFEAIVIPEGVTSISNFAFKYSKELTEISIPASATYVGSEFAFGCSALKNINVSPDNKYYTSENGVLFNKDKTILMHYPVGKTDIHYVIPETVTEISEFAFDMAELISIVMPESVTKFSNSTFRGFFGHIGYMGSPEKWDEIYKGDLDSGNPDIIDQINRSDVELHCNFNPDEDITIEMTEKTTTVICSCGYNGTISLDGESPSDEKFDFVDFFFGWIIKLFNWFKELFS